MGPAHCPGAGQCTIAMVPRDALTGSIRDFSVTPLPPALSPESLSTRKTDSTHRAEAATRSAALRCKSLVEFAHQDEAAVRSGTQTLGLSL